MINIRLISFPKYEPPHYGGRDERLLQLRGDFVQRGEHRLWDRWVSIPMPHLPATGYRTFSRNPNP